MIPQVENFMQILTRLFCLVALLASAASVHAQSASTTYTGGPGERDVMFGGVPVADGNYVEIGYFTPGFNVSANAGSLSALAGAWQQLDFTTTQQIFAQGGRFGATASTSSASFDNQKVALWLFKTSDNAAPASGFGNVQGYGVYSSTGGNWFFPFHDAVPPGNMGTVTSSEVNTAYFGTFDANHLLLTPVPEPSIYALLALSGGLVLVARLRKRIYDSRNSQKS